METQSIIIFSAAIIIALIVFFFLQIIFKKCCKEDEQQQEQKDYLLNISTGEIHYLPNKQIGCNIEKIKVSTPLSKEEAEKMLQSDSYDGCGHCMPEQSKRNKK